MYLLTKKACDGAIDMGKKKSIPEVWSTKLKIGRITSTGVRMIFLSKQDAFITKYLNRAENVIVTPLEEFLALKDKVDGFKIKLLNSTRFTFMLRFSEDLEVMYHPGRLTEFNELFNYDKIIMEICKQAPDVKSKLDYDKTSSYESAEIFAIETVRRIVKKSSFKLPFTFFNKKKAG